MEGTIGSKQDTDLCNRGGLMSRSPANRLLLPYLKSRSPPSSFFLELVLKQEKYEVLKAPLVSKILDIERPELFKYGAPM